MNSQIFVTHNIHHRTNNYNRQLQRRLKLGNLNHDKNTAEYNTGTLKQELNGEDCDRMYQDQHVCCSIARRHW